MGDVQMLFPMEPKEFWQKLKVIVEQVVIEHGGSLSQLKNSDDNGNPRLLKVNDVCKIFRISKPTLYEWMNQGKLPSIKIESRRFFRWEDVQKLIEQSTVQNSKQT